MRSRFPLSAGLLVAASVLTLAPIGTQEVSDESRAKVGKLTFQEYCRSCHGDQAKGDGPVGEFLSPKPADLTRIAERNRGEFPSDAVAAAITGGKSIKGHGSSEMPVWGSAFRKIRAGQTEEEVKERIAQLVLFLKSIQVPTASPP